ncbi:hypothetical protein K488DRAFT_83701 [Vararia minispora EC-137]|uniref:Uncharacterized protein n=1 Tax=Vararia minispora EC-137 TaxID=1314806 RepID=A0ACB8QSP6_9AGAM|nr:hypothetical protein K488DRAFT_83701 [Vararia minispora EC-137]
MAKTSTIKTVKTASKIASAKSKQPKLDKDGNPRTPSAWSTFLKDNLKAYKDKNPGCSHGEAMKEMATLWDKSPLNPNAGKPKKSKAPRVTKGQKNAPSSDEEGPQVEPGSDD